MHYLPMAIHSVPKNLNLQGRPFHEFLVVVFVLFEVMKVVSTPGSLYT